MVPNIPFILASASPQRRVLLSGLGLDFSVIPSALREADCAETDPARRAEILAELKAKDVASAHSGSWVLGCDTLVVAPDGMLLEKPSDADDARKMLVLQSGGVSTVHSALCLIAPDSATFSGLSSSRVHFRVLTAEDIDWWISTGQWNDRSGSFQIDGLGQLLIAHLEGDWAGVVGLPVFLFGQLVRKAGLVLF